MSQVATVRPAPGTTPAVRRPYPRKPRCGLWMPLAGTHCGRRRGHRGWCHTPESVERQIEGALRRRAERIAA